MHAEPRSQLVVQVDRRRVNRRFGLIMTMNGVVLVCVLAVVVLISRLHDTGVGMAPFVIVIAGQVFQMTFFAWIWGVQVGVGVGMVVSAGGISVPVPPYGSVGLSWEAIGQIQVRGRHLVIRPVAGLGPQSYGVDAATDQRLWRRLHKRGALVPTTLVDTPVADMASAIQQLSGGRVAVQP